MKPKNTINNCTYLLIILMMLLTTNKIHAQVVRCGTPEPSLERMQYIRNLILQTQSTGKAAAQTLVTIPVAFHVIRYDDGSGDISDQIISNQLAVMNSNFAGTNFQFSFFSVDRTNNTTWTSQTLYQTAASDEINMKSQLVIDPAYVLNFYFCANPNGGILLGLSRRPDEYPEDSYMHGVIIKSTTVLGGSEIYYNEGKTATHETGHYLGLYHTFQKGCNYPGDDVDDTPYEAYETSGCPDFKDTCPLDGEDPYHNYMDYSYDNCLDNFTPGQVSKMHSVVSVLRPTLYSGGATKSIALDQRLNSGAQAGTLKRWLGSSWSSSITPGTPVSLTRQTAILGDQNVYSNQKYYRWERNSLANEPNILNHHSFTIKPTDGNFTSRLNPPAIGVTINNLLDGNAIGSGQIEFQDPWFVDYTDIFYGNQLRNRGTSAIFIARTSPFTPNFTSSFEYGRKYNGIFLNENPNFLPNLPIYSVRAPLTQDIYLSQTGKTHKFYFQNWGSSPANSASFQQVGSNPAGYDQKAVVFTSGSAIISANLKGTQLSDNASAYSNNSQRKLVKTKDNWMHQVYESMGRVWLEHSTDNGSTWFLGNNAQPLDNGGGKCPSIDWHYNSADPNNANYNAVVVVYQQPYGSTYTIQYAIFKYTNGSYIRQSQNFPGPLYTEPAGGDQYSSTNANPNIAWGDAYRFVLTFERKTTAGSMLPGIYWISGAIYESGIQPVPAFPCTPVKIVGTSGNSINAAVSKNKVINDYSLFDVVYQTDAAAPANITDVQLFCYYNGSGWTTSQLNASVISYQTGYLNTKPSIVQMPDNNIRVSWIRNMYGSPSTPTLINTVYWNSALPSVYTYSGNGVNSVSLNIKDGTTNTYYAYAQNTNNTTWQNFASNNSSTITLNTTGRDIQLSNGSSSSSMYASAFYPVSLPYYFATNSIGGVLKTSGKEEYSYGRGIVLEKDKMGFSYSIKSLIVDKTPVKFVEIPESNVKRALSGDTLGQRGGVQPLKVDSLNTLLISEPFNIKNGTTVGISEDGGFITYGEKTTEQQSNYQINCTIELIEAGMNKSLGVIKQIQFTPGDERVTNLRLSSVNINSKDEKTVRLKMSFTSNISDLLGMFVNEYNTVNEDMLSKLASEKLTLNEEEIITTYALEQNYPNPFNPSTTIRYQVPKDGNVTLKIYDLLGNEVATLVNENKTVGSYGVNFKASTLASGVYFYQLKVNDFAATKKLILMK